MKINIKPLSVNQAYTWRRFKTENYRQYEKALIMLLPKIEIKQNTKLKLEMVVWINWRQDIDWVLKCFIDILQRFHWFNDNMIYEIHIQKEKVKKWQEYIDFDLFYITQ